MQARAPMSLKPVSGVKGHRNVFVNALQPLYITFQPHIWVAALSAFMNMRSGSTQMEALHF